MDSFILIEKIIIPLEGMQRMPHSDSDELNHIVERKGLLLVSDSTSIISKLMNFHSGIPAGMDNQKNCSIQYRSERNIKVEEVLNSINSQNLFSSRKEIFRKFKK